MNNVRIPSIAKEPLIQFFVLALMVFSIDSFLAKSNSNPQRILIDDKQVHRLIAGFEKRQGRKPTPAETNNLVMQWSQNEILYREALMLGMDKNDDTIRTKLISKMRGVLLDRVILPPPTDSELKAFYDAHLELYQLPARYDFEQFQLVDINSLQAAQQMAESLLNLSPPKRYAPLVRRYKARVYSNLSALFGKEQAKQLVAASQNHWHVIPTDQGLRLARITKHHEKAFAEFADIRDVVLRDWRLFNTEAQFEDQTKIVADQYTIDMQLCTKALDALAGS